MLEKGDFSDQALQSFQTRLVGAEINKPRTDDKNPEDKLEKAKATVQSGGDQKFWPSVMK